VVPTLDRLDRVEADPERMTHPHGRKPDGFVVDGPYLDHAVDEVGVLPD
jgi:hypothetical protein